MTTYLLITSDKPTELTAFVGPKKPEYPVAPLGSPKMEKYLALCKEYARKMETAKASRLLVVNNAVVEKAFDVPYITCIGETKCAIKIELDTPVELEGWEPEIVYQYRTNHWATVSKEIWDSWSAEDRKRQAYRLRRSESHLILGAYNQNGGNITVLHRVVGEHANRQAESEPRIDTGEESQEELFDELIKDVDKLSYSEKLARNELPKKWIITRKQQECGINCGCEPHYKCEFYDSDAKTETKESQVELLNDLIRMVRLTNWEGRFAYDANSLKNIFTLTRK